MSHSAISALCTVNTSVDWSSRPCVHTGAPTHTVWLWSERAFCCGALTTPLHHCYHHHHSNSTHYYHHIHHRDDDHHHSDLTGTTATSTTATTTTSTTTATALPLPLCLCLSLSLRQQLSLSMSLSLSCSTKFTSRGTARSPNAVVALVGSTLGGAACEILAVAMM